MALQLPGMRDEPVRVSIDFTWYPSDDVLAASTRVWIKDSVTAQWELQAMEVKPELPRHAWYTLLKEQITSGFDFLRAIAEDN